MRDIHQRVREGFDFVFFHEVDLHNSMFQILRKTDEKIRRRHDERKNNYNKLLPPAGLAPGMGLTSPLFEERSQVPVRLPTRILEGLNKREYPRPT